jgi:hypothetical protein
MGDGTGARGALATTWPVLRAGFEARARLTCGFAFAFALALAFTLGLECLEDTGVLFLRWVGAVLECREGFRDEDRADRGAFFLFKSFSLLESRAPSWVLGARPEARISAAFYQRDVVRPQRFFEPPDSCH